jgi:hypothetical protein
MLSSQLTHSFQRYTTKQECIDKIYQTFSPWMGWRQHLGWLMVWFIFSEMGKWVWKWGTPGTVYAPKWQFKELTFIIQCIWGAPQCTIFSDKANASIVKKANTIVHSCFVSVNIPLHPTILFISFYIPILVDFRAAYVRLSNHHRHVWCSHKFPWHSGAPGTIAKLVNITPISQW